MLGVWGTRLAGEITQVEVIASGPGLRELRRLRATCGGRRWRKLKGVARVRLDDGGTPLAEIHWFEAHGVGRREMKVKRILRWS